jgi:DNA-binding MarR family transcriptional regulator
VTSEAELPVAVLALQRATHATLQAIAAHPSARGLAPSEINVLANLGDGHPSTVSELGAATGTRPSTLTGVLDRLEGKGLLAREAHPADRRALAITLTPAGRQRAEALNAAITDLEHRALSGVAEDALAGFHTVLRALTAVEA